MHRFSRWLLAVMVILAAVAVVTAVHNINQNQLTTSRTFMTCTNSCTAVYNNDTGNCQATLGVRRPATTPGVPVNTSRISNECRTNASRNYSICLTNC